MSLIGQRQDYTFRSGVTYYIFSPVQLFGQTTLEGGAIIKFDASGDYPTLQILGSLRCKGGMYKIPAVLTWYDDNSFGVAWSYAPFPQPVVTGVPFLDLTGTGNVSINNLDFRYADMAVSTPLNARLDVWNCQFFQCDAAVVADSGGVTGFHNVLLAGCGDAVAASTNGFAIEAEQIAANATRLWEAAITPSRVSLTNSIVVGNLASGPVLATDHTAINPAPSVFQAVGSGSYYLTNTSPYRRAGTTAVSARLLAEFQRKSTQAPVAFPACSQLAGEMTLGPQAERYTNGAPDYGYYYPALDYTVAWLTNWGTITVLPGTAIGFCNEYSSAQSLWTWWGFDAREGSSFVSHGTPTRPNTFTDVQFVQEQLALPCFASFVPDFWPNSLNSPAPSLDFRFCNFYANPAWFHVWSGYDRFYFLLYSPDSLVNWRLQDCNLHGGRITLGEPDDGDWYGDPADWVYGSGAVSWNNNLFDNVAIDLDPTFYGTAWTTWD